MIRYDKSFCENQREVVIAKAKDMHTGAPTFYCDCVLYCGTLREVSRSTYFLHAPHRQDRIRTALIDFLGQAEHPADPGPVPNDDEVANHDEDMPDSHEDDEDTSNSDGHPDSESDNPHMQPDGDFDDLYADDPVPDHPPHVEFAHAEPGLDPYVEPLPHADEDGELAALDDAEVCISHNTFYPTKASYLTGRTGT